ncbi:hypothetical protein NEFER02_2203 [Nematocida sp. LUAm2]|nr:hypothetical protein NEFER02_2203 [Nematocida sp. LUAm2]
MQKINTNRITTKIAILAIFFILMLDLSQTTSNLTVNDSINASSPLLAEDQEAEKSSIECINTFGVRDAFTELVEGKQVPFMPQPKTKNELLLNTFSFDDLPKHNNRDYQLIFASWDVFKAKCEELADKDNSPEFKDLVNYYEPSHTEIDGKFHCIIDLESVFSNILKKYKENHLLITDNYISIYYIISNYPERSVTEEKAAIYLFGFFNSINTYIKDAKDYLDMYYELQSASPSEKYITSTKDLLNLLLAYAIFIDSSAIYGSATISHIWDKVKLSSTSEQKKLIRYCEFILSHTHEYKNYNIFYYPTTQSRIEEIEKDVLSDNHILIKNHYSINLLYFILLKNIDSNNSLRKLFLGNQEHGIYFDYDSLTAIYDPHLSSSQLSKITNRIALADKYMPDVDAYITIIELVLLCGIDGTIEILTSSTDQQNTPKYMQFKKNIEGMILNKDTKVVFNCNEPEKLEELPGRNYYKNVKKRRENNIANWTKSEKNSKSYIGFFISTTISIFVFPFLSLVSTTAATLIPILLPVIIFIFALFVLYTLSQKENKIRKTSILRGVPIAAIIFLALYIISTFVITDMNNNPLILKTVQLLLLSEFSLVVLFGVIASGLIIKSVGHIKKRFRARLALRIVIYALSILLLLLPLIMILIGYKTDAMLLIRSDIMVFSSILFFIGALLEDQNYNDFELQAKRERNRRFTWTAVALFAILLIICISVIYLCSLNKPFDAVTEVNKDSSLFYRFFSSLPMNFYPTSVIPNTP